MIWDKEEVRGFWGRRFILALLKHFIEKLNRVHAVARGGHNRISRIGRPAVAGRTQATTCDDQSLIRIVLRWQQFRWDFVYECKYGSYSICMINTQMKSVPTWDFRE